MIGVIGMLVGIILLQFIMLLIVSVHLRAINENIVAFARLVDGLSKGKWREG